jgi:hypothetical protein
MLERALDVDSALETCDIVALLRVTALVCTLRTGSRREP